MTNKVKRDVRLHMLLSKEERKMLDDLAKKSGLNVTDLVRQLLRSAYEAGVRRAS